MDGGHRCEVCKRSFELKRYLTKHVARMHPDGKIREKMDHSLPCGMCGKVFQRISHLQRHQLTHLKIREFDCPFCGEKFSQKVHLIRHVGRRHPNDDKRVLEKHLGCTITGKGELDASIDEPSTSGESCAQLVRRFLCVRCWMTFTDRLDLERHTKNIHEASLVCNHCNKVFQGIAELKKHELRIRGYYYSCKCGASFETIRNLKNHENSCLRRAEFQCLESGCGKEFCQRVQLDRHWKKAHFERSKCEECDFEATAPLKLAAHVLSEHEKTICGFCGLVDPPPTHIASSHWIRRKQPVPFSKTKTQDPEEAEESGSAATGEEDLSELSRPMSAEDASSLASLISDEVESSEETTTSVENTEFEETPPTMPPEIPISRGHPMINVVVPVPKDTTCLELGSRLPKEILAAFPELKEAKVVLSAECQGREVSLMVPITSATTLEKKELIKKIIYL